MWSKAWQENSSNWHFYPARNAPPFRISERLRKWNTSWTAKEFGTFSQYCIILCLSQMDSLGAKFKAWTTLSIDLESKNHVDLSLKLLHLKWQVNFHRRAARSVFAAAALFICSVLCNSSFLQWPLLILWALRGKPRWKLQKNINSTKKITWWTFH